MKKHCIEDKIDKLLSETVAVGNSKEKYMGHRPIQIMRFWKNYRPGDRLNVNFGEDGIEIFGTNSEGQFAGSKAEKEMYIDLPVDMDDFRRAEGDIWNFV
jgi:hypothetical protein